MAPLATATTLRQYLKDESSKNDPLLTNLVTRASDFIRQYCGRDFEHQTYTGELYDGTGTDILLLRHAPLTLPPTVGAVTPTVLEHGAALTVGEDPVGEYDILVDKERGALIRPYGCFYEFRKWYKVTYSAGYVPVPPSIEQACVDLAVLMMKDPERIGIQSKTTGQQTVNYVRQLPDYSRQALDLYREQFVMRS